MGVLGTDLLIFLMPTPSLQPQEFMTFGLLMKESRVSQSYFSLSATSSIPKWLMISLNFIQEANPNQPVAGAMRYETWLVGLFEDHFPPQGVWVC